MKEEDRPSPRSPKAVVAVLAPIALFLGVIIGMSSSGGNFWPAEVQQGRRELVSSHPLPVNAQTCPGLIEMWKQSTPLSVNPNNFTQATGPATPATRPATPATRPLSAKSAISPRKIRPITPIVPPPPQDDNIDANVLDNELFFPDQSTGLDRKMVMRLNVSMALQLLMFEYIEGNFEGDPITPPTRAEAMRYNHLEFYEYFADNNDAAVVARQNLEGQDPGVCHLVFRATTSLTDWIDSYQNLVPWNTNIPNSDCLVRDGFYNGAFLNDYSDDFDRAVYECLDDCIPITGERCPTVISGLSSGGGIAVVASIVYRQLNPMVLNMGGLRAIVDDPQYPCTDAHPERHYRFTNSNVYGDYDFSVNLLMPLNVINVGHHIYLDETNWPLFYAGFNEDKMRTPFNQNIHHWSHYRGAIHQMLRHPDECYPIPLSRWPVGHVCGYQDECDTRICVRGKCAGARLLPGKRCNSADDCASGDCRSNANLLGDLFEPFLGGPPQSGQCT